MYINKKVVVFGGTGLLGKNYVNLLVQKNYEVTVFVRKMPNTKIPQVKYIEWNYIDKSEISKSIENIYAVVNIAGSPISKKWNKKNLKEIQQSRINTTKIIVELINECQTPPVVLIQASAVGYYNHNSQEKFDEFSSKGNGILSEICYKWEQEAQRIRDDVRLCIVRSGIVLSNYGGFLPRIIKPIKNNFGAIIGNGKQIIPWIHIEDYLNAMLLLMENSSMFGVFNLVSTNNCTMEEICKKVAKVLKRPILFKIPDFAIKLLFGKMGEEVLLASQNIEPKILKYANFEWKFAKIEEALKDLIKK